MLARQKSTLRVQAANCPGGVDKSLRDSNIFQRAAHARKPSNNNNNNNNQLHNRQAANYSSAQEWRASIMEYCYYKNPQKKLRTQHANYQLPYYCSSGKYQDPLISLFSIQPVHVSLKSPIQVPKHKPLQLTSQHLQYNCLRMASQFRRDPLHHAYIWD